jgi:hypothetical protein
MLLAGSAVASAAAPTATAFVAASQLGSGELTMDATREESSLMLHHVRTHLTKRMLAALASYTLKTA